MPQYNGTSHITKPFPLRMYLPLLSLLHECLTTPLISNENQDFPHNPADKNVFENLANQDHLPEIIAELGRIERVSLSVTSSCCGMDCQVQRMGTSPVLSPG